MQVKNFLNKTFGLKMEKGQKTYLITGGNRGLGLAICSQLARDKKNKVLMACRNIYLGKKETHKLNKENNNNNVIAVLLDLSMVKKLDRQIQAVKRNHKNIDVLINNAAVSIDENSLTVSRKTMEEVLQVNTLAPLGLIQAFAPQMIKNNYGRIVNISSGCAAFSDECKGGQFAYTISKTALNVLTLTISRDLPNNVKINCMCPGSMRTRMGGKNAPRSSEESAETALWLANLGEDGPTGLFFRDKKQIPW